MSGTNQWGPNNHQWKGDNIGYHSLHKWLRDNLPKPEFCELCGKKPAKDIANISGEYNRSFDNYLYICYRCHCDHFITEMNVNERNKWEKENK